MNAKTCSLANFARWCALVASCALFIGCIALSAHAAPVKIRYTGGVEEKFPNLNVALQRLVDTLDTPDLWGDFWNQKVKLTGRVTNYRFSEMAPDLRRYLSDGSLEIEFRENKPTAIGTAAAQTVSVNKIILFPKSGRSPDRNVYSDYYLARTVFHELMHVWQRYKFTSIGLMMDTETFPTEVEKKLPQSRFSTTEYNDVGGRIPLPPTSAAVLAGVWRDNGGCEIRMTGQGGGYAGVYLKLNAGLKSCHFEEGELGFRNFAPVRGKPNTFEGEVEWRWTNEKRPPFWQKSVITLNGDYLTITACSFPEWTRIGK